MMTEYEYLFSMAIQQKLKRKIKGKIFVAVTNNDDLLVKIMNEDDGYEYDFKLLIPNITNMIHSGLSSNYVAHDVVKKYKEFIYNHVNEKYFYQD